MRRCEIIALASALATTLVFPALTAADDDTPTAADGDTAAAADRDPAAPADRGAVTATDHDVPPQPSAPLILEDLDESPGTYWRNGTSRIFVATQIDIGFLYVRPRGMFGYGRPFHQWLGIEANPIASTTYIGGYGGLRGVLPWADLRVGGRYVQQIARSYLGEQSDNEYTRRDTEDRVIDGNAHYIELETELSVSIDAGPGDILAVATGTLLVGIPNDQLVYEDLMRVVANAPGFWRGRLGYSIAFDRRHSVNVGAVAELIGIPGRNAIILRAGLIASVKLWPNLEVRASFVPALISPDTLGISGGDFGNLGVRWSWASE